MNCRCKWMLLLVEWHIPAHCPPPESLNTRVNSSRSVYICPFRGESTTTLHFTLIPSLLSGLSSLCSFSFSLSALHLHTLFGYSYSCFYLHAGVINKNARACRVYKNHTNTNKKQSFTYVQLLSKKSKKSKNIIQREHTSGIQTKAIFLFSSVNEKNKKKQFLDKLSGCFLFFTFTWVCFFNYLHHC